MPNNHRGNDQLGDYSRVPAKLPEDESSEVLLSSSPSSKAKMRKFSTDSHSGNEEQSLSASQNLDIKMKNKNLLRIWNKTETVYEIEKKIKEPGKLRTILKTLRYAKRKDKINLMLSVFLAISVGFIGPFNTYAFHTPVLTVFIKSETVGNPYNINMTEEIPMISTMGYGYLLSAGVTIILGIAEIMACELAARNIMARVKTAYLSKMLSMEIGWYDKSEEQFVNTVVHDLQKMVILFDSKMINIIEMFSSLIFGCFFALLLSWKVALFTLGTISIFITIIYSILQASKTKEKSQQQYISNCTKITSEVLGNACTVAAYGGEYKEIERFNNTLKMVNKIELEHTAVTSAAKALNYFALCICYMATYYLSVKLYLFGNFNPGALAVLLPAQSSAVYYSTYLLSVITDLNMAMDSAYRVMRFLDTETSYNKSIKQGIKPDTFKADVSFRNVQFSYPTNLQTKALQDLTLDIELGKVTAVVGTSGAGKSTIVNLISRLYDVNDGQILIGGVDIKTLNVGWLRNHIGVVRQEPTLFDTTIEENIRYGKTNASLEEIMEAAKISYAHSFIEKLPSGYDSIVGERGIKLSGGQKQRIAIARAIVRKPKLLLLDEATSALDYHSEGIVKEALDNAMRGRTTLIIAHRMSTVRNADVIYAIKEGRVVEKGSHSELMELKGYYYSLVKIQELEEKDKAVALNQKIDTKEELINEAKTPAEEHLEVSQNNEIHWLRVIKPKVIFLWFLAVFFTVITSTFLPIFFHIFGLLCKSFTYSKDEVSQIALIDVTYLLGLGITAFFSVVLTGVTSTISTQLWMAKLQTKTFSKIVSMDISWFDRKGNSPNECLEILTNSPPLIKSVTGDRAAQVIIFVLSMLFGVVYSFLVSARITMANVPIFIVFFIINYCRIKSRKADAKSASILTRSTKIATEYVQSVRTIQILNCQKHVVNGYQDMLVRAKKVIFTLISVASLTGPALILMSQYPAARQAVNQLYRIANTKTILNTLTDQGIKPEISGNIEFQDVMFSYPTRKTVEVLKKLNLKIEAGKTVALVGDSGCGKTTIVSLLERFYLPNEGKILIDGNDINDINVRYLRSQMGLVSQEPVLFDMTIKENILYGLEEEITMDKVIEAAKIANIHDFIMNYPKAYDTSVGERGSKLSGGQKQRIAIARAVLRNPKILLLDEATSALDTENEKMVQEALENASVGRTTIVIAHRLSTIRKADKIVVIQSGAVVEEGDHEQLMESRGHYYHLLSR
ncbi:unnamed protein product [Nezara viridula]|uniref:Uncharacterized protein n=1 Tax=Nezara viridula TaxID=85310 RepID=A0A9P0H4U0_NEZVI|nr:unnamed protein product [Nezara viridula]